MCHPVTKQVPFCYLKKGMLFLVFFILEQGEAN